MDDAISGSDEGQQQGGNRRHAARKSEGVIGLFPDAEAILEDLLVGAVEARIDEAFGAARALAGHALEESLARRGVLKNESGGQEDRRLQRAFAKLGIEAIAHHQCRGLQLVIADGCRRRARRTLMLGNAAQFVLVGQIGTPLSKPP